MSPLQIVLIVVALALLFWVVGAYNRLMAQRNDITQAWARLHDTLRERATAVAPLVNALREPMAAEQGALDALVAAHSEAVRSATEMAARPVDPTRAQAWVSTESALASAASRVLALLEQHSALRSEEPVAGQVAAWQQAQERLPFARQAFNEGAAAYNDAVALFPTSLLARGFGFGPTGSL